MLKVKAVCKNLSLQLTKIQEQNIHIKLIYIVEMIQYHPTTCRGSGNVLCR